MDKLIEARKIISEADKQIAELFETRMKAVKLIFNPPLKHCKEVAGMYRCQ